MVALLSVAPDYDGASPFLSAQPFLVVLAFPQSSWPSPDFKVTIASVVKCVATERSVVLAWAGAVPMHFAAPMHRRATDNIFPTKPWFFFFFFFAPGTLKRWVQFRGRTNLAIEVPLYLPPPSAGTGPYYINQFATENHRPTKWTGKGLSCRYACESGCFFFLPCLALSSSGGFLK